MKLSTKGRYGVCAMFDLAYYYKRGPISLKSICTRQAIPENYLEQLLTKLKKAGLVTSVRGPRGGFKLVHPPEQTTVRKIMDALGEETEPAECAGNSECVQSKTCAVRRLWMRLDEQIAKVLGATTLADMCGEAKELARNAGARHPYMYYI